MSIWLILIVGVLVYIALDAFFEISAKISGWVKTKRASVRARVPARPAPFDVASVFAFFWRWKAAFLILAIFITGVSLMRGCAPIIGKSKGELRLEREIAEGETEIRDKVIERNDDLSRIAADMRVLRNELRHLSQRGRDEIAAVTPSHETPVDPQLIAAWRGALDRLCLYPSANGDRSGACGSDAPQ